MASHVITRLLIVEIFTTLANLYLTDPFCMVLEIQFRSVKYTTVTGIRKNFKQLFILRQAMQATTVSR